MMQESMAGPSRRKPEKENTSEKSNPPENSSANRSIETDKIENVLYNQSTKIRNELVYASILPFFALLGVGSSPTLYACAFGGVASYVMDLLESLEGAIISFVLTMFAIIGTLIYASRDFLSSSVYNLSLIPIFAMVLYQLFMVILTQFNVFMYDMGYVMRGALQIAFITYPLCAATFLSVILAFSLPEIDLHVTFILIYFLYTLLLGYPKYITRKYWYKANAKSATAVVTNSELLLSFPMMKLVYSIPIVLSILTHCALHHNVLTSTRNQWIQWFFVICFPSYLMLFCYQQHLPYYQLAATATTTPHNTPSPTTSTTSSPTSITTTIAKYMLLNSGSTLIAFTSNLCLLGMIIPLYNHPYFDEVKSFSGLPEPLPTYMCLGIILSLILSNFALQRLQTYHRIYQQLEENEEKSHSNSASEDSSSMSAAEEHVLQQILPSTIWLFLLRILLDSLVGTMIGLVCCLLNIPSRYIPIHIIAAVSILEFHFLGEWQSITKGLLGLIAALSCMVSVLSLMKGTVYHIQHVLVWSDYTLTLSFPQWCHVMTGLVAGSVILPALLPSHAIFGHKALSEWLEVTSLQGMERSEQGRNMDMLLPTTSTGTTTTTTGSRSVFGFASPLSSSTGITTALPPPDQQLSFMFAVGGILLYSGITFMQLLLLEEDWSQWNMTAAMIYPDHYFTLVTLSLSGIAMLLYHKQLIGFSTCLVMSGIVLGSYFLFALHFSSKNILFLLCFVISNCLPFTRQLSAYLKNHTTNTTTTSSTSATAAGAEQEPPTYVLSKNYLSSMELGFYIVFNGFTCLYINHDISIFVLQVLLQKNGIAPWQEYAFSLAIWLLFISNIGYIFYRKYKILRSIIFSLGIIALLISLEGFGMLVMHENTFSFEDTLNTAATAADAAVGAGIAEEIPPSHGYHHTTSHTSAYQQWSHLTSTPEHAEFFLILSGILTLLAWMRYVSLENLFTCLAYSLLFAFISTKATIPWVFPRLQLLQAGFTPHTWTWYAPFAYLYVQKCLNTFFAMWTPPQYETRYPALFTGLCLVTIGWPITVYLLVVYFNFHFGYFNHNFNHNLSNFNFNHVPLVISQGIIWSTLLSTATLTCSLRVREVLAYIRYDNVTKQMRLLTVSIPVWSTGTSSGSSRRSGGGYSVVMITALLTILWTLLAIFRQTTAIDSDLFLPGMALILLVCDPQAVGKYARHTPVILWCCLVATWWYLSLVYHTMLYGYHEVEVPVGLVDIHPTSIWGWDEQDISFWTNASVFLPCLNLALGGLTVPGLYLSYTRSLLMNTGTTQSSGGSGGHSAHTAAGVFLKMEVFIICAIVSLASLIGSNLDCVRYLAVMSFLCCVYHAYLIPKQVAYFQSQEPFL